MGRTKRKRFNLEKNVSCSRVMSFNKGLSKFIQNARRTRLKCSRIESYFWISNICINSAVCITHYIIIQLRKIPTVKKKILQDGYHHWKWVWFFFYPYLIIESVEYDMKVDSRPRTKRLDFFIFVMNRDGSGHKQRHGGEFNYT